MTVLRKIVLLFVGCTFKPHIRPNCFTMFITLGRCCVSCINTVDKIVDQSQKLIILTTAFWHFQTDDLGVLLNCQHKYYRRDEKEQRSKQAPLIPSVSIPTGATCQGSVRLDSRFGTRPHFHNASIPEFTSCSSKNSPLTMN